MARWSLALIATLGCASTGGNLPDASVVCPDDHRLAVQQSEEWVTLTCEVHPGVPDGPAITWDRDAGRLISMARFENGQLDGPSRTWHPNGHLWQESHYVHGSNEGGLSVWHDNGQLAVRANYEDDQLEGAWIQWREDGSLRRLWHWHKGQMHGPYIVWHPNGQAKIVGGYDRDQRVGRWMFWDAAGELERVEDQTPVPASAD